MRKSMHFKKNGNVAFWHKPDLRFAAPEGRFTGGLLTLGTKIGKLPASEFSLARNQAENPSNKGGGVRRHRPPSRVVTCRGNSVR